MAEYRKIIHIDMDAFYASVEQRDFPEYRGKPLAVGGSKERGVVAAASYEARKFGVRSAMPSSMAYRRCPEIIFVKPRFEVYKAVSQEIRKIFERYTDLIEPLSLDEAYLDVTKNKKGLPSATIIAEEIRSTIYQELNLTASAGISVNKFLAKVASDINKPNGMFVIKPDEVNEFINKLPVKKFYGVGKVTAEKLHKMGVYFGRDLHAYSINGLTSRFGKMGHYLFDICRGVDNRAVVAFRERKSLGAERTFTSDIRSVEMLEESVREIAEITFKRLSNTKKVPRTLTLKVKFSDFKQITRSVSTSEPIDSVDQIIKLTSGLLKEFEEQDFSIRLVGVSTSNFIDGNSNLDDSKDSQQLTIGF